ncbi:MAG TPA: diguanylate cyclase [Terriglobia bacterium]|nr:diguanylate cyclase [Terriglobia bacterium]
MRILIAEDDPVSRRVLQAHLTKWGYEVVVTNDGVEAWSVLQKDDPPPLAILDWMMPSMDGPEVIGKLRQRRDGSYIYVLLLTAKSQKEDIVAGLEAGADDYLVKPFDAHELRARIRTGKRILDLQNQLITVQAALREEATHDPLTKAWNHAGILEILQREYARAQRVQGSVGVVMADLDHFKPINDTYGHLAGDEVLRELTRRMIGSVRAYDAIGRYGGEEFVIVFPDCGADSAFQRAEQLQRDVTRKPIETNSALITVTASLGVAASDQGRCEDYEALLRAADAALYRSKAEGRNRTTLATCEEIAALSESRPVRETGDQEHQPSGPPIAAQSRGESNT